MKALRPILILAALLSAAVPTALQAVAVPEEIIQSEMTVGHTAHGGALFLIFAAGVAIGIWIQKRLNGDSR